MNPSHVIMSLGAAPQPQYLRKLLYRWSSRLDPSVGMGWCAPPGGEPSMGSEEGEAVADSDSVDDCIALRKCGCSHGRGASTFTPARFQSLQSQRAMSHARRGSTTPSEASSHRLRLLLLWSSFLFSRSSKS
jgi:hypothetical protein